MNVTHKDNYTFVITGVKEEEKKMCDREDKGD